MSYGNIVRKLCLWNGPQALIMYRKIALWHLCWCITFVTWRIFFVLNFLAQETASAATCFLFFTDKNPTNLQKL